MGPISHSDIHPLSSPKQLMLSGVSLLAVSKVNNPVGLVCLPLCDVVSSFLCHTHTDGKDKLLEWTDRSCLLLYVSASSHPLKHSLAESIFVSRVQKTAKKILVSRKIR
jgi:hypothetical protein